MGGNDLLSLEAPSHPMLSDLDVLALFERLHALDPDQNVPPAKIRRDPFESLVSVMLSAQSRDEKTAKAAAQLFAVARTPEAILALAPSEVAALIRPCGLYNTKARNLHAMCRDLIDRFGGRVPSTRGELMSLPGVGRKSADILERFVFGRPRVAVDTHVHRVCNRLGLAFGRTEAQTATGLEPRVPRPFAMGAHVWLLDLGKGWCKPRRPRCESCPAADLCQRHGVEAT